MSEMVKELRVIDGNKTLFDTAAEYVIPLYQRAYAWEDKQLVQLVEDINDVQDGLNYYIGSLIVSKNGNRYEVVDGQQRLTSLYLLLNVLGFSITKNLRFDCRDKSNYTLENISDILTEKCGKLDMDRIESTILKGVRILSEEINRRSAEGALDKDDFIEKLSRIIIFRIEVPQNTDLNRYFEIMNTRGEQLEQHDILKATLMSYLKNQREKTLFASIWDACSDMTGYVQMHFDVKTREEIFGGEWNWIPSNDWNDYKDINVEYVESGKSVRISDIIKPNFVIDQDDATDVDNNRVRFESIIDFPYFLLHALKVYVRTNGIEHEISDKKIVDELLDDKKLIESFRRVIEHGVRKGKKIADRKGNFSRQFIVSLLLYRYCFDQYIIKREYANDDSDGEWSLKSLYVSGQQSKKRAFYANTRLVRTRERKTTNNYRNDTNIMLQSAMRVSYTSPKIMHWITEILCWLTENECEHTEEDYLTEFDIVTEHYVKDEVRKQFFGKKAEDGGFDVALGVNTPHIVFNYLDFLIWKKDRKKYADFVFEFRNSVEHWYPQNPSGGTFEAWHDGVDQFGNLCIIQRNVNSKFSNMAPEAKKSTFRDMIAKGSLKLRIMSELTEKSGDKSASLCWRETVCKEHEEEMMQILKMACGIEQDS